ncbi:g-protein alpha subunit domain-containing protein [Ditylenchus destructor]|uniref:G-protein alpha subunit domain-containing protein n=1 Tax=Ditylenchus destructor TaxID=166010 RepID=A0AAD4NBV9_9BILA|nr:g-protein alpha subunit domain-containing protein [Ditylenchus destructor]
MGACESNNKSSAEAQRRNRHIDRTIEQDKRQSEATIKLLLLGAGESGKSTVLKQMKIIHENGFSDEEARAKRNMVYGNAIQAMFFILSGMHKLRLPFTSQACQEHGRLIHAVMAKNAETEDPMRENVYTALKELWADKGVQASLGSHRAEFYVPDCAEHFLDSMDRIYAADYIPTTQDILFLRVATMGVIEVSFKIKEKTWRVFDVGGQRSQRKKWIHCFDDVRALIFVTAMSEFDQVLMEDGTTNRLQESLQLFKQVCNNKYFIDTSIILFLNKKDLFEEKMNQGRSLRIAFKEFNGPDTYEASSKYIEKKFFMANEVPNKSIYCHHTCATDTKQVEFVLESVYDSILSSKLKGCGLY